MKTALTIAGSDSSGGAGIQADIKTMTAYGVYAMSAIGALTAQNTTGVYGIMETPPEFLGSQLDAIFTDIYPDAIKIGMLPSKEGIRVVGEKLRQYHGRHIVLDPVMVATSGSRLVEGPAIEALKEELFPLAELITPNIPETEVLTGLTIRNHEDMEQAAGKLYEKWGISVLCKGGHLSDKADDLLYENGQAYWIRGERIENPNTHGTGCTLSSAIASGLALGMELREAVEEAKAYLTGALKQGLNLGTGSGPLNHMYGIKAYHK